MIYVVNGAPRSGKDTFCSMVAKFMGEGYVRVYSTVDYIKTIAASAFGWNGEKTPRARKFLSDLKDLLTEWNDIPFKDIQKKYMKQQRTGIITESIVKDVQFLLCAVNQRK